MFLMYHYYHAEEVYNAIRIMITCYVWMTGFGNFSFFYIKQVGAKPKTCIVLDRFTRHNHPQSHTSIPHPPAQWMILIPMHPPHTHPPQDFGFVRFVQMLWRLNFLVLLLCMSQGNTYILYYICPLHTFYFLLVYATMRVAPHANHGKWDVRCKLMVVAVLIYVAWDLFGGRIFALLFGTVLSTDSVIGAKSGCVGVRVGGCAFRWWGPCSLPQATPHFDPYDSSPQCPPPPLH